MSVKNLAGLWSNSKLFRKLSHDSALLSKRVGKEDECYCRKRLRKEDECVTIEKA